MIKGLSNATINNSSEAVESFYQLLNVVPEERLLELAELLVDFTQKHDSLLQFISHVVAIEVGHTSKSPSNFPLNNEKNKRWSFSERIVLQ